MARLQSREVSAAVRNFSLHPSEPRSPAQAAAAAARAKARAKARQQTPCSCCGWWSCALVTVVVICFLAGAVLRPRSMGHLARNIGVGSLLPHSSAKLCPTNFCRTMLSAMKKEKEAGEEAVADDDYGGDEAAAADPAHSRGKSSPILVMSKKSNTSTSSSSLRGHGGNHSSAMRSASPVDQERVKSVELIGAPVNASSNKETTSASPSTSRSTSRSTMEKKLYVASSSASTTAAAVSTQATTEQQQRAAPTMATTSSADEVQEEEPYCRTALIGEQCYDAVKHAMDFDILIQPEQYPGLTASSSFVDFQKFLANKNHTARCQRPCGEPCLCVFGVHGTLLQDPDVNAQACPINTRVVGVTNPDSASGDDLMLSPMFQELSSTFCRSCYRGIVSSSEVGGKDSEMRHILTSLMGGVEPTAGGAWSDAGGLHSLQVSSATTGKKHLVVINMLSWLQAQHGLHLEPEQVFFFDDGLANVAPFKGTRLNARQISCDTPSVPGSHDRGLCGGTVAEVKADLGVRLCGESEEDAIP